MIFLKQTMVYFKSLYIACSVRFEMINVRIFQIKFFKIKTKKKYLAHVHIFVQCGRCGIYLLCFLAFFFAFCVEVLFYGCEGLLTAPPLGEIFITSIIQISHYNFINGPFAMFYHTIVIFVVIMGACMCPGRRYRVLRQRISPQVYLVSMGFCISVRHTLAGLCSDQFLYVTKQTDRSWCSYGISVDMIK